MIMPIIPMDQGVAGAATVEAGADVVAEAATDSLKPDNRRQIQPNRIMQIITACLMPTCLPQYIII